MSDTVTFKSTQEMYRKEYLGTKPNTIRKDDGDIRFKVLEDFIQGKMNNLFIQIENASTGESFTRQVTDVSRWTGWYIISWQIPNRHNL